MSDASERSRQFHLNSPARNPFDMDVGEAVRYWQLIPLFVRRDFVAEFSQTILGPVWFIIHPVVQSVAFALVFGVLAQISTDQASPFLFYNGSLVLWTYFMQSSTYVSQVFISNAGLFGKVHFPRVIVPVSIATFRAIPMLVNYAIFLVFMAAFWFFGSPVQPNVWVLATPLLMLQVSLLSFGVGAFASAFTVRSRDVVQAFSYLLSLWMYATPIIYPLSSVPERYYYLFYLNPMTSVIEVFRYGHLGTGVIDTTLIAVNAAETLVIFALGLMAFNYAEKTVVDTV